MVSYSYSNGGKTLVSVSNIFSLVFDRRAFFRAECCVKYLNTTTREPATDSRLERKYQRSEWQAYRPTATTGVLFTCWPVFGVSRRAACIKEPSDTPCSCNAVKHKTTSTSTDTRRAKRHAKQKRSCDDSGATKHGARGWGWGYAGEARGNKAGGA